MKQVSSLLMLCACSLLTATAYGQQVDAAFGFNGVHATSAANASSNYSPQSIGGGLTPSVSADVLLWRNFGASTEFSWRGGRALYQPDLYGSTLPFRPIFYDFNGIWAPPIAKNITAELMAGIGLENTRFYVAQSCGVGCQNFATTNHFLGHFGGGIRYYVKGNLFVRPEAHVYLVHNNQEFSSPYATRYGVSVGYTFGSRK